MGLFKRYKENPDVLPEQNIIAKKLGGIYNRVQSGWADGMAQRTAPMSKKDWVIALACFVGIMGGYSTYLLVSGFTGTTAKLFTVTKIRKPAHAGAKREVKSDGAISDAEYNRIQRFHTYMDSLAADPSGKILYDSITKKRPGLIDSVRQVEYYYQQLKRK